MKLDSLQLTHFRNYNSKTLRFDPSLTCIVGPNAHGKTNVLEAILFMCTGKGIKESKQQELIQFGSDSAELRSIWKIKKIDTELRIILKQEETLKKGYFIDKAKKSLFSYRKHSPAAVLFVPEMIAIIDGSPRKRRIFIDEILSTIDIQYRKKLRNYEQGIRKRNKVLERFSHTDNQLQENLQFWDEYLIEEGTYIQDRRTWLTNLINREQKIDSHVFSLSYEPNIISETRFQEYRQKEKYQRRTLIGPLRDDFGVILHKDENLDTRHFVSRGEQRLALFWLIIRQIHIYTTELENKPILLLDDIFSELDEGNKKLIFDVIDSYQTVLTATDVKIVKESGISSVIIDV